MKRIAQNKSRVAFPELDQSLNEVGALPRLHLRSELHIVRKIWHLTMGSLIAFIYLLSGMSSTAGMTIIGSLLAISLIVETARLRIPALNRRVLKIWAPFMRAHECSGPSAVPPYLLSTLIAIAIFPKPVAVLSILYLAYGDPIASLFGILYGDRSIRLPGGKSLIGTAAGTITCILVSFAFLKMLSFPDSSILAISVLGGLAGGTAELMPIDVDDNLSIPVISGFVLWLTFILFGF
ncbi:MAG: hypothetical protein A2428_14925 [Bdellovibrionales bacterium RIFOXYC1_FULL_54_43]|nr:MAG: hypothetical protein A2428_14925 [Bdellovibrionales bacterium RIFOXYC1_FULL_54_43]OFZ84165.1 MAG: hypothetical protein A2603_07805 [Bdellovibrionales bacterium RIFOXYD1_FULL_55_31]